MGNDSRALLEAIRAYQQSGKSLLSSDKNIRIATIDPYFTTGRPRVLFDGEPRMGERTYTWDSIYSPRGGDRVFMIPVGSTYIIAGKVGTAATRPVFINLPYLGDAKPFDAAYPPLRATKTASGVVSLSGMISMPVREARTVITQLPPEFRPLHAMSAPVIAGASGYLPSTGVVEISTDGQVYFSSPAFATGITMDWCSMENITYPTSPSLQWTTVTGQMSNGWQDYNPNIEPMLPGYTKDTLGRVWFRGYARPKNPLPPAESVIFTVPEGYRPEFQMHFTGASSQRFSGNDVTAGGEVRWKKYSPPMSYLPQTLDWYSPSHTNYIEKSVGGWTDLPYQNGFNRLSASFPPLSYRKDSDGVVHLRGLIGGGPNAVNKILSQLPEGFRPAYRLLRLTVANDLQMPMRFDIRADGVIELVNAFSGYFSLDGQSFVAEQ